MCKRHLWYIKNKSAKIWKQTKCIQTNKWIKMTWYVSVQFSLSDVTPWTTAHQASLSITNSWSLLKLSPLSHWCHSTISSSVILSSSYLQSFPAVGSFLTSQFFTSGGQSIGVSALASVLPMALQGVDFFKDGLFWSPCSPRDSQESSPTPQVESINSSVLSFLYHPTLTSIYDY